MISREKERWEAVCEQASNEQDSAKLMVLMEELNGLLEEKDAQVRSRSPETPQI